ncbi:MAG: hypothetical protein JWM04_670 [Verrucomicrobiales bacterium]|nr:hypothetical protein [Verrucomicrobiales bacterium]
MLIGGVLATIALTSSGCYSEHRVGARVYEPAGAEVQVYSNPSYGVYHDRDRERLEHERWNQAHPRSYYEYNHGRDFDARNWQEEREREYQREHFQR